MEALLFRSQHRRAAEDRVLRPQHRSAGRLEHCGAPVHLRPAQVPSGPETLLPVQSPVGRPVWLISSAGARRDLLGCTPAATALPGLCSSLVAEGVDRGCSYPRTESSAYPASFEFRKTLQDHARHPVWGDYAAALLSAGFSAPKARPLLTVPASLILSHSSKDLSHPHFTDVAHQIRVLPPRMLPAHALFRLSKPEC